MGSPEHAVAAGRLVPLRRPPLISVVEGPFVPERASLDEVDRAWEALVRRVPRAFDGPMLHVLGTSRNGHGGVTIHCTPSNYRFHAVIHEGLDTGMRPLGVKAITFGPDGRVVMGRRGMGTLNYPGLWEFASAGTMEPGISPADMILRELAEETGWRAAQPPAPRALLFDPVTRTWEVVFAIDAEPGNVQVEHWECAEVRAVVPGEWPGELSPVARQMMPILEAELRARGR
jgi:8-oxo-dGTP pyrophosphatase MutT (NUDIX family)